MAGLALPIVLSLALAIGARPSVSDGSGPALAAVTNPGGSTANLIFDIHKYLGSDGSGTSTICLSDEVSSGFAPVAQW